MRPARRVALSTVLAALAGCPPADPGAPARTRYPDERAVLAEALARADADGDRRLQAAEYERYPQGGGAEFRKLDADGDGSLDLVEFGDAVRHEDPGYEVIPGFQP